MFYLSNQMVNYFIFLSQKSFKDKDSFVKISKPGFHLFITFSTFSKL